MLASLLVKLLQQAIKEHGDHEVWSMDDHCKVGMVTVDYNSMFSTPEFSETLIMLDWSRDDYEELQVMDGRED